MSCKCTRACLQRRVCFWPTNTVAIWFLCPSALHKMFDLTSKQHEADPIFSSFIIHHFVWPGFGFFFFLTQLARSSWLLGLLAPVSVSVSVITQPNRPSSWVQPLPITFWKHMQTVYFWNLWKHQFWITQWLEQYFSAYKQVCISFWFWFWFWKCIILWSDRLYKVLLYLGFMDEAPKWLTCHNSQSKKACKTFY